MKRRQLLKVALALPLAPVLAVSVSEATHTVYELTTRTGQVTILPGDPAFSHVFSPLPQRCIYCGLDAEYIEDAYNPVCFARAMEATGRSFARHREEIVGQSFFEREVS